MTHPRTASLTAAALAIAALGAAAPLAAGATADQRAAQRGATWLQRSPVTAPGGQIADTIVALKAARRGPRAIRPRLRALRRVAPRYADTAGGAAKVTMGAVAGGADPTRFGGHDYVRRITSRYAAGRYGATVFDQALSMLALRAAGRPIPARAVRTTLAARGAGGWNFAMTRSGRDMVDGTGLMIEALRAAGVPSSHRDLRAATAWMTAQRNAQGGYTSAGGPGATQANPTSNVIRALRAMGRPVPARTRAALRAIQERSGAVRFTGRTDGSRLLATTDAVVAFSGHHLPIR